MKRMTRISETERAALWDLARTTFGHSLRTIAANAQINHGARVSAATLRSLYRKGLIYTNNKSQLLDRSLWRITASGRSAIEGAS